MLKQYVTRVAATVPCAHRGIVTAQANGIRENGIRVAAIKFRAKQSDAKVLFNFRELGFAYGNIRSSIKAMPLQSIGATVVRTAFTVATQRLLTDPSIKVGPHLHV